MKAMMLLALTTAFATCGPAGTEFVPDHGDAGVSVHAKTLIWWASGPFCRDDPKEGFVDCGRSVDVDIWSNVRQEGKWDDALVVLHYPPDQWIPQGHSYRTWCIYDPVLGVLGAVVRRAWSCLDGHTRLEHIDGGRQLLVRVPRLVSRRTDYDQSLTFTLPAGVELEAGGPSDDGPCLVQSYADPDRRQGPEMVGECGYVSGF